MDEDEEEKERERNLTFMWFGGLVGAVTAGVFGWSGTIEPMVGGGLIGIVMGAVWLAVQQRSSRGH